MIEFKVKTFQSKIEDVPDSFCQKFSAPLIFYISHMDDFLGMFITFVIVDYPKREITFVHSYLPENIEKFEQHPQKNDYTATSISNPHCSVSVQEGEDFLSFMEGSNFFFYVNYQKHFMRVYLGGDLACEDNQLIKTLGCTFFKDTEDPNYFYFTAEKHQKNPDTNSIEQSLHFYRATLDLKSIQTVFQTPYDPAYEIPHMTRQFKQYILNSEFSLREYKSHKTGEVFQDIQKWARLVFNELYKEYCYEEGITYDQNNFKNEIHHRRNFDRFSPRI